MQHALGIFDHRFVAAQRLVGEGRQGDLVRVGPGALEGRPQQARHVAGIGELGQDRADRLLRVVQPPFVHGDQRCVDVREIRFRVERNRRVEIGLCQVEHPRHLVRKSIVDRSPEKEREPVVGALLDHLGEQVDHGGVLGEIRQQQHRHGPARRTNALGGQGILARSVEQALALLQDAAVDVEQRVGRIEIHRALQVLRGLGRVLVALVAVDVTRHAVAHDLRGGHAQGILDRAGSHGLKAVPVGGLQQAYHAQHLGGDGDGARIGEVYPHVHGAVQGLPVELEVGEGGQAAHLDGHLDHVRGIAAPDHDRRARLFRHLDRFFFGGDHAGITADAQVRKGDGTFQRFFEIAGDEAGHFVGIAGLHHPGEIFQVGHQDHVLSGLDRLDVQFALGRAAACRAAFVTGRYQR